MKLNLGSDEEIELEHLSKIHRLEKQLEQAKEAIRGLIKVTDEYAAEFIQQKRSVDWGVVNEAFLLADKVLDPNKEGIGTPSGHKGARGWGGRGMIIVRESIHDFAVNMERKLRRNDHKGGWQNESDEYLMQRLLEEFQELQRAVSRRNSSARTILNEAVDIANFAMMIADNAINRELRNG